MFRFRSFRYALASVAALSIFVVTVAAAAAVPKSATIAPPAAAVAEPTATPLLLQFVPNVGQWRSDVLYLTRAAEVDALFMRDHIELHLNDTDAATTLRLQPLGANAAMNIQPSDPRPTLVHDFRGRGPGQWHTHIPSYEQLRYVALYPDIDLAFRTQDRQLAYDFILHPGADPSRIRIAVEGAQALSIEPDGSLNATLPNGRSFRQMPPFVYQEQDGVREPVSGRFQLLAKQANADSPPVYGFDIGAYDPTRQLIVDPTLSYSSFVGGRRTDKVAVMHVSANGKAIVAGTTSSTDFAAGSANPITPSLLGSEDVFIYQMDAAGSALDFVALLGGSGKDELHAMAFDGSGNIYLTGTTSSSNFPVVDPLFAVKVGTEDAFIAKLDATGSTLDFSTFYGGNGKTGARAIGLDKDDNIYIAGMTTATDLVLRNPFQALLRGGEDGFILRLDEAGGFYELGYATYFGGTANDRIENLIVSATGDLFFAGNTSSPATDRYGAPDFWVKHALQSTLSGRQDSFLARIARGGQELIFSTYLGGSSDDVLTDLAMDADGHYLLGGYTSSSDWPTHNALMPNYPVGSREPAGTLAKVDNSGRFFHFSTYLGALNNDRIYAVAPWMVTSTPSTERDIYVAGVTHSNTFPVHNDYQGFHSGKGDGFLTRLDPSGQIIRFSSYYGGTEYDEIITLAPDPSDINAIFFAGNTDESRSTAGLFPSTGGSLYPPSGSPDTFVSKLTGVANSSSLPLLELDSDLDPIHPDTSTPNPNITFTLRLKDRPATSPGVIAFSTTLYYDPAELSYLSTTWESGTALDSAIKTADDIPDSGEPGRERELELTVYQEPGAAVRLDTGLTDDKIATIDFALVSVGTPSDDPPLPSRQLRVRTKALASAAIEGDLDATIYGAPGVRLIERRCNSLLGDCDCSGRVQLFEVQFAVTELLGGDPTTQPICVKRDYGTMAPGDLTEIVNLYTAGTDEGASASARYLEAPLLQATQQDTETPIQAIGRLDFGQPRIDGNQVTYDLTLTSFDEPSVAVADLHYDPAHIAELSVTTGPAAASAGKQARFNLVEPGWLRILVYGINQTTIPNGVVGTLTLTLASGRGIDSLSLDLQTEVSTETSRSATFDSNSVINGMPTASPSLDEDCTSGTRRIATGVNENESRYLQSTDTMTVTGAAAVHRGGELVLVAPRIRFEPGFSVANGGQLKATAAQVDCSAPEASAPAARSR